MGAALVLLLVASLTTHASDAPLTRTREAADTLTMADTLDMGFERSDRPGLGIAKGWSLGGEGYRISADSVQPYSGHQSIRVERTMRMSGSSFGAVGAVLPADEFRGKRIRLHGYVSSRDVTTGFAGLWIRADDSQGEVLAFDNMHEAGVVGTTPWGEHTVEVRVDSIAKKIVFGALLSGDGAAWFDALSLEVDGHLHRLTAAD